MFTLKRSTLSFILLGLGLSLVVLGVSFHVMAEQAKQITLNVPYVSQVPDGSWVAPWDEACEEASITMIEGFYAGQKTVTIPDSKQRLREFFTWEEETFKKKDDTTAEQTNELIQAKATFRSSIRRQPTLEDIKQELALERPVMALVNMFKLYQEPNLGDSFHVLVIHGYDDEKSEFLVKDPAREKLSRVSYTVLMNALHDFNPKSGEADAEPTVLFTSSPLSSRQVFLTWFLSFFR